LAEHELGPIWWAAENLGHYTPIIRLLMLTGQRAAEIGGLQWSEINMAARQIELPAARTKNKRAHLVPLAPLALAQLPEPREGFPNVFGQVRGRGFSGWSKGKALLDAKLIGMKPWTPHDLRRTFCTLMNDKSIALPHIIEACVNHISGHKGGVAGVYNRAQYAEQKRAALEAWAAELARIVGVGL
jgi:integrase